MNISAHFDSGKIEVIDLQSPQNIQLRIPKDTESEHFQWFFFRATDVENTPLKMNIINAHQASYPEGYEGYQAVASYDKKHWFRVPTHYNGEVLSIEHCPEYNAIFYAYFAPFTYQQHLDLVHQAQCSSQCKLSRIGQTIEGKDIDILTIGQANPSKRNIWIIARQHPGETMAEWFMKGLIESLLDQNNALSKLLLQKAVFYIVPNMNIDGSIAGNLRVNTKGFNYNREWAEPHIETAPEVYHVRNLMDKLGCDLNLDIHGDEALPYNFISGIEGIPSFNEHLKHLTHTFIASWLKSCPDFQDEEGYPKNEPKTANLNICSKHIGERFKCLSLTIEMPFKDNANLPNTITGWSPQRAMYLGASVLFPISQVVDILRE